MKFLICGLGSIGQRHYKNLQALGHDLAVFRSSQTDSPFIKKFLRSQKKQGRAVKTFFKLNQALLDFKPNAVFITNPAAYHIKIALEAARSGCHLFIEKPLSHNLTGLAELEKIAKKKKLKIMIGYNFRFHPLLRRMKELTDAGVIGRPLSAHAEAGENVMDWHPWEDYRQTYPVNKNQGGGVVLCFSHEIDYLCWFLGKPKNIAARGGKLTPLFGDVEDTVKSLLRFPNNVIASLHLDFWQRPKTRTFTLIGTKGKLTWDCEAGTLILQPHADARPKVFKISPRFERNDMYVAEAEHFIAAIKKNQEPLIALPQGRAVLEVALEIKKNLK